MSTAVAVKQDILNSDIVLSDNDYLQLFGEILNLDVANGDARADTIQSYKSHVGRFMDWCRNYGHDPSSMGKQQVKRYRKYLLNEGLAYGTVALKLTIIRRFFQGLVDRGYMDKNPAKGVKPPRDREADDSIKHLTPGEAELFINEVKKAEGIKGLRDRAMIAMMLVEGWRVVEVVRASVEDINFNEMEILTKGKGKDAYIYPREDTLNMIQDYLDARGDILPDEQGTPLFVSHGNYMSGQRMSRNGIRKVVNKNLKAAGVKRPGISCHALRHTCGMEIMRQTGSVKAVQVVLRHSNISTSGKYAHLVNKKTARITEKSQITF